MTVNVDVAASVVIVVAVIVVALFFSLFAEKESSGRVEVWLWSGDAVGV